MTLAAFVFASYVFAVHGAASPAEIDPGTYAADSAAQKAWVPMQGSAPAATARIDSRPALRFRCNFSGTTIERASWDQKVNLDLSACRGIAFDIYCRDASPVSYFSIYFESDGGWYRGTFFPEEPRGWNTIKIDKREMQPEGAPAGWGKVKTIRISAWRGADSDTEFCLSRLRQTGILGEDAAVAIINADDASRPQNQRGRRAAPPTESIAGEFSTLGIGCSVIPENEISHEFLKKATLVVLPQGPAISEANAGTLHRYATNGGKLLVLSPLPAGLRALPVALAGKDWLATNLPPATAEGANRGRALLAAAGTLAPQLWREAAQAAVQRVGTIAGYATADQAAREIEALKPGDRRVQEALASAKSALDAAVKSSAARRYAEALDQAASADAKFLDAFCLAQSPPSGEFRAFWCHSAFGVKGMSWDEAIRRLADNGFTAILPNMLWGGVAYYDSKVLPQPRELAEQEDQIRACLAACRKHHVQVHVWKVNWNLGSAAPKEFADKMRREGRLQENSRGQSENWLCPSHPDNQKLEIDSMLEVARNYDVDGIHFDYIRYPDSDHCFCAGCRERFGRAMGAKIENWPQAVLADGSLRKAWLDWRRSNITAVVKAVSEGARVINPRIKVSAAVFRNWTLDRDGVGQDWKLWCEKGYLDFVCPMDYTPSNNRFETMVAQQCSWAGNVPCYPGIGVSASSSHFGPDRVIEQINLARKHKTGGFVIFNYGVKESLELLPKLGMGITAQSR